MRKIYTLTEAGRERFRELMAEPLEYGAEAERIFHRWSTCSMSRKTPGLLVLSGICSTCSPNLKYVFEIEAKIVAHKPEPEQQRIQLLRMFDHRKHVEAADIEWVS